MAPPASTPDERQSSAGGPRLLACFVLAALWHLPSGACRLSAAEEAASGARLEELKTFRAEFVPLAPGKGAFPADFLMGCDDGPPAERPAQRVTIVRRFAIGRYEVTQKLWRAVMGDNPSRWTGPRNAVEMVSAHDAAKFCQRATDLLRAARLIDAGELVRLPTEAEWEYAARAGTTTRYSFGDDPARLGEFAWFHGNAAGNDPPVGAKKPNSWQLYDMHGYLWEWCSDEWRADYAATPAAGAGTAHQSVLRGGSWKNPAERLTSTFRRAADDDLRDDAVGLRCVLAAAAKDE